jgi:hypothetical protein
LYTRVGRRAWDFGPGDEPKYGLSGRAWDTSRNRRRGTVPAFGGPGDSPHDFGHVPLAFALPFGLYFATACRDIFWLEYYPDYPSAVENTGLVFYAEGRPDIAGVYLARFLALEPNSGNCRRLERFSSGSAGSPDRLTTTRVRRAERLTSHLKHTNNTLLSP